MRNLPFLQDPRLPSRRASLSLRRSSALLSRSLKSRCSLSSFCCCSRSFLSLSRWRSSCSSRSLQTRLGKSVHHRWHHQHKKNLRHQEYSLRNTGSPFAVVAASKYIWNMLGTNVGMTKLRIVRVFYKLLTQTFLSTYDKI